MAEDESLRERRRRILKMMGLTGVAGASGFLGEAEAVNVVDGPATNNEIIVNVLVEDLNGDPIEGAMVELEDRGGSPDDRVGTTDTDGRIKFIEGVGPPPENCQTLKLKLMGMDRVKNLGCRNAPATVSATFQVDRDKLRDSQDGMEPIPEEVRQNLDAKKGLIESIRDEAILQLPPSATRDNIDDEAEILCQRIEEDYPEVPTEKREQLSSGIRRLLNAESVTAVATRDSPDPIADARKVLKIAANIRISIVAIIGATTALSPLESAGKGEAADAAAAFLDYLLGLLEESGGDRDRLSDVESGTADFAEQNEEELNQLSQDLPDDPDEFQPSQVPDDLTSAYAGEVYDEAVEFIVSELYEDYYLTIGPDASLAATSINPAINNEVDNLEELIDNSSLPNTSESELENEREERINEIDTEFQQAVNTVQLVIPEGIGSSIELTLAIIALIEGGRFSAASAYVGGFLSGLTVGGAIVGDVTINTIKRKHELGVEAIINPDEDRGIPFF